MDIDTSKTNTFIDISVAPYSASLTLTDESKTKERKMTPFEEKGWDENTVLEVIFEDEFSLGSLVKLLRDDNSDCPKFQLLKGSCNHKDDTSYYYLDHLKEHKVDKKETLKQTIAEAKAKIEEAEKQLEELNEKRLSDDVEFWYHKKINPYSNGRILCQTNTVVKEYTGVSCIYSEDIEGSLKKGSDLVYTECKWEDLEVGDAFWDGRFICKKSTDESHIRFLDGYVKEYGFSRKIYKLEYKPK